MGTRRVPPALCLCSVALWLPGEWGVKAEVASAAGRGCPSLALGSVALFTILVSREVTGNTELAKTEPCPEDAQG